MGIKRSALGVLRGVLLQDREDLHDLGVLGVLLVAIVNLKGKGRWFLLVLILIYRNEAVRCTHTKKTNP